MDIENLIKNLTAKFGILELTRKATEKFISEEDSKECEMKVVFGEKKLLEIDGLMMQIQEEKLLAGESIEDVETWDQEWSGKKNVYKNSLQKASDFVKATKQIQQEEQNKSEKESRNMEVSHAIEKERIIHDFKMKLQDEYERKLLSTEPTRYERREHQEMRVKLPHINISKFEGNITDFLRFWSTFSEEIDKSSIPTTSKFSYLKELLSPKVRLLIDGLPFSSEGYERAKSILSSKFGQPTEIVNAHVTRIMNLTEVSGCNPLKIHEFYENLVRNVQSLETMGKLQTVNGYARMILDRLPGIRADLVRDDEKWKEWGFVELVEALRRWVERNPVESKQHREVRHGGVNATFRNDPPRERLFRTGNENKSDLRSSKFKNCVYCQSKEHKSIECSVVSSSNERKRFLAEKKLCFNCTGEQHRASRCQSNRSCMKCGQRHHSSICDKESNLHRQSDLVKTSSSSNTQPFLLTREPSVIYPVVVIQINGIKCRALLDTGAGSSYISAGLIDHLGVKKFRTEGRQIEMMFSTQKKKVCIYSLEVNNSKNDHLVTAEMTKVDRQVLLTVRNPRYDKLRRKYKHLNPVEIVDCDEKEELPVHVILGASEYARVKTSTKPLIGNPGEPIAEHTRFGWAIISPGSEKDVTSMMLTRNSSEDYDRLCGLDVLGIEDAPEEIKSSVHEEFKNQLKQCENGQYETGLIWKVGHPQLPSHETGSLKRLSGILRKLKNDQKTLNAYDQLIREQLDEGIVEKVPADQVTNGKVFYLPHKAVTREEAESTKIRQVCDASARENERSPSLNDCLEPGPILQNLLWNVVLRIRFRPIVLCGDLKKAFLQVIIRESDRDVLRFHWIKSLQEPDVIEILRFTRALFGLNQSPFILAAVLLIHLERCKQRYPEEIILEIIRSLYVDDLISTSNRFDVSTITDKSRVITERTSNFVRARSARTKFSSFSNDE